MPAGIIPGLWIVPYIRIGVHAVRVVLHVVRAHKPPAERIIIPEVVVEQPGLTIEPFASVVERGGHAAPGIVNGTVGTVMLQSDDLAGIVEGHAGAAQGIAEQIIQRRPTDAHGDAGPVGAVVLRGGRRAAGKHRFRVAIKIDGIGRAARVGRVGQHAVALQVVEVVRAAYRARGRAPGGQLTPAVVAHHGPGGAAARAGVGATGIGTTGGGM